MGILWAHTGAIGCIGLTLDFSCIRCPGLTWEGFWTSMRMMPGVVDGKVALKDEYWCHNLCIADGNTCRAYCIVVTILH